MTFDCASEPKADAQVLSLTPLQVGMVYESTFADRPWTNLEQVVVHLDNESVCPAALRRAWATVAARHDALRSRILWEKRAEPVQVIEPAVEIELTVEDWQDHAETDHGAWLERFLRADRERGVDLKKVPSWRVALFRLAPRKSVMVWTIHHALVDGRSMAIVLDEVFAVLAQPGGQPGVAAPGPRLAAFHEALHALDTADAQTHFRAALAGFDDPNTLIPDRGAAGRPDPGRKALIERRLDRSTSAALSRRAQDAGATLANLVHAAWGLVVARTTGRHEAVFGVTRSGRFIAEGCDALVGCLINTLPVRVDLLATPTTDALLRRLRADSLAMRPYEHAALTDIRRWIGFPAQAPLFDTLVMVERASLTETLRRQTPVWKNRRVDLREEGALPMTLAVYADPQMLVVLEHDQTLIAPDRAQAMLDHFIRLLGALAASHPETPLADLTMLAPAEEQALLTMGRPAGDLPDAVPCLATRIEDRVAATPRAPALSQVGTGVALNFETLDRRANGLAHRLVAEGAGPGQIVAICLERSPDFVVAMLAILKAGAAFLPVDPSYPRALIDYMLTDSGTWLVVAHDAVGAAGRVILPPDAEPCAAPPNRPAPDPDRLAYVIYTSGSTGKPKGVRVPQRAASAHASAIIAAIGLTPDDRCLQFASLSFDVAIEEMLPTLIAGASLVMRDDAMSHSIPGFLDAVEARGLTVLNLPTAFWHILVDEMARTGRALPGCVRLVIVGGEQINPRSLATWQTLAPGVRWLNGYGPTETTITCTLHEPGTIAADEDIPIGRPTLHARAYVLAADRSLVPAGCDGDLWIGGPAVSDGYIGLPETTARSFVPDPFAGQGRMYRTGDRARWRPDGTLAFLGRQDRQVKLRGFRIDLRQVETVLEREAGVGRALVRVLDADSPAARLVAWVTGADGLPPPDAGDVRQAAARVLAPHMLPAIVGIAEFPRTPGGKIDTAALPAPDARLDPTVEAAPADAQTAQIAALMARALRLKTVGPDDSFHDLGGHSLLAVQLIGQIEAAFGLRLGVGDLHRNPTPRALSAAIASARVGPRYIIPIQPKGSLPPLFGVHVLGHNESFFRPLAARLEPDQPVLGLTVGPLTADTPVGVEATARCYFEDIQRHYPQGPVSLAAVSLGSYIAFELARQLRAANREVRMLALFDAEGPTGRARLAGVPRLLAHVRRLRHRGAGYFRTILANRISNLQNRIARFRVQRAATTGEAAPLTLSAFVAANELAVQEYKAGPIDIPLTIFRAQWDVFDSPDALRDGLGWASVARAGFDLIDVPGDHLSILEAPQVDRLAAHIRRVMGQRAA